jgi:branched-chain amino acid transport system substrate-binding protein
VKTAFLIGPDYAAGRDMLNGARAAFKGEIVGQEFTRWPDQLDFSAELSDARAKKPGAIFVFYPGAAGVQFLEQYTQLGFNGQIPLYSAFTIDETTLPTQKDLALGVPGAQEWVNDLPNDANRKFVADFRAKYKHGPSFYGSQSYDAANLVASAVTAVSGDLAKKDAMRDAMAKAAFASVRGAFRFGNNHFPIQSFYLQEVVKAANGELALKTTATIVTDDQDKFHDRCPMK